MQRFNRYDVIPVVKLIEAGDIESAVELTLKNRKTKARKLAGFVAQVTGSYLSKNNSEELLDRHCLYLRAIDS